MDQLKTYKDMVNEINKLISKLEASSLTIEELFELETLTRKLHERSIILRYKAFENKLGMQQEEVIEPEVSVEPEPVVEPEKIEEVPVEETPEEEEVIDFSMFGEPEDEELVAEPEEESEPVAEVEPEPEEKEEPAVEPVKEVKSEGGNFLDKFQEDGDNLGYSLAGTKLDTLIGAFGLNEKLRYINDLFDGSSDLFSDAIKVLDSKSSIDEASNFITELAETHEWDHEEDTVAEFIVYVKRRYA